MDNRVGQLKQGRPRAYRHVVIKTYTLRKGPVCEKHKVYFTVRYTYPTGEPSSREEFCRLCQKEEREKQLAEVQHEREES